jgi:putative chitinase
MAAVVLLVAYVAVFPWILRRILRRPIEVASRAYGGRNGNAPYPSLDGYTFRGRGALQLTGRANYEATNRRLGIGLDTNPELAAVPALSLLIACDFYQHNGVLAALDHGDTTGARRITNGGAIGLDNVNKLRAKPPELIRLST